MYYTKNGEYPKLLPNRIRLPNGQTRTLPFTEEDISFAGYRLVDPPPNVDISQKLEWTGVNWLVSAKNSYEIESDWNTVRKQRDEKIKEVEWRYSRFYRHERLGLPQIDSIQNLDTYIQALADITKQTNPYAIIWPVLIV